MNATATQVAIELDEDIIHIVKKSPPPTTRKLIPLSCVHMQLSRVRSTLETLSALPPSAPEGLKAKRWLGGCGSRIM